MATGSSASRAGQRRTTTRLLDGEYPEGRLDLPHRASDDRGGHQDRRPHRGGQARGAGRRAQHPGAAAVHATARSTIDAGSGDEAQASEAVEAALDRPEIDDRVQPAVPARRPRRRRRRRTSDLASPSRRARRCSPGRPRRTARPTRSYRYVLMPRPLRVLTGPTPDGCRGVAFPSNAPLSSPHHTPRGVTRCSSDWSGWARWAATCASGSAAPGTTVVGYDRNPDVSDVGSLADMVEQLPSPAGRVGDGPAGDPTRDTVAELADLLDEGDLVIDGGNSQAGPTTRATPKLLKARGHRLRRLRRLRRRLGPGERLRPDGAAAPTSNVARCSRSSTRCRPEGRVTGLRARRQGRRRPLRQDGPQRHRVRHDAGLRRGLGAAREGRTSSTTSPGSFKRLARGHGRSGPGCSTCWSRRWRRTRTSTTSPATPTTPARAAGRSRRRSTTPCRCRSSRPRCSPGSPPARTTRRR